MKRVMTGLCLVSFLMYSGMLLLPAEAAETTTPSRTVADDVQACVEDKALEKRRQIMKEAVNAIDDTRNVLRALDEGQTDEALALLERVIGKLALITARDPKLSLAPMDVSITTFDLYGDLNNIKQARKQVKEYLASGDIQNARRLLSGLASEIVISQTCVPLATYPKAIKAIVPLIDTGKIEEAKTALQAVLSTLVVINNVIPLPLVRAEEMLAEAEALAEKKERTSEENDQLETLLQDADSHFEMAAALGYITDKDYEKTFLKDIEEIKEKTESDQSGSGWFDKIKNRLADLELLDWKMEEATK